MTHGAISDTINSGTVMNVIQDAGTAVTSRTVSVRRFIKVGTVAAMGGRSGLLDVAGQTGRRHVVGNGGVVSGQRRTVLSVAVGVTVTGSTGVQMLTLNVAPAVQGDAVSVGVVAVMTVHTRLSRILRIIGRAIVCHSVCYIPGDIATVDMAVKVSSSVAGSAGTPRAEGLITVSGITALNGTDAVMAHRTRVMDLVVAGIDRHQTTGAAGSAGMAGNTICSARSGVAINVSNMAHALAKTGVDGGPVDNGRRDGGMTGATITTTDLDSLGQTGGSLGAVAVMTKGTTITSIVVDITTRSHVWRGRPQLTGIRAYHRVSSMTPVTVSIGPINNRTVSYICRRVKGVPSRTMAISASGVGKLAKRQTDKVAVSSTWGG